MAGAGDGERLGGERIDDQLPPEAPPLVGCVLIESGDRGQRSAEVIADSLQIRRSAERHQHIGSGIAVGLQPSDAGIKTFVSEPAGAGDDEKVGVGASIGSGADLASHLLGGDQMLDADVVVERILIFELDRNGAGRLEQRGGPRHVDGIPESHTTVDDQGKIPTWR